jgi:hypothetical protein
MEPAVVVLSKFPVAMPEIFNAVVEAVPTTERLPLTDEDADERKPVRVERPETESVEESVVAPAVSAPNVAPPTALSWPLTVVEPVTASAVVVAPAKVAPPLNAMLVVVALPGKRYPMVLVMTPVVEL